MNQLNKQFIFTIQRVYQMIDVNQLMITNVDYGELVQMPIKNNHSRLQIMEEEEEE